MNESEATLRHALPGLDAANPLGFLAAIGTLRTLTLARSAWCPRLAWNAEDAWRPVVQLEAAVSREEFLDTLEEQLNASPGREALALGDNIKFTPEEFRRAAVSALRASDEAHQETLRFLSAFGSEATQEERGLIEDTALRTMSGAGHQHFLKFMRDLIAGTERHHLHDALFRAWRWDDPQPSLRWDPADDRRYALRWREPSGDPIRTVRGANRLAIEALPMLTTAVQRGRLRTVGFVGTGSRDTYWTWPVWTPPADLDVVRSLLSLSGLQADRTDRRALAAMGIADAYRARRLTIGKYRNFTLGEPL